MPNALPRQDTLAPRRARRGFDFTWHVRQVCVDMIARLPELQHIDMDQVAISMCQARNRETHGLHASLTPMRFEGGRLEEARNRQRYVSQRLWDERGREMLYILSFYLPRFLDNTFEEKLITIVHELWHIGPEFDGDLRRFAGRCHIHTHSEKEYDRAMALMVAKWLKCRPPRELYGFIELSYDEISQRHGGVFGTRVGVPRLIPRAAG